MISRIHHHFIDRSIDWLIGRFSGLVYDFPVDWLLIDQSMANGKSSIATYCVLQCLAVDFSNGSFHLTGQSDRVRRWGWKRDSLGHATGAITPDGELPRLVPRFLGWVSSGQQCPFDGQHWRTVSHLGCVHGALLENAGRAVESDGGAVPAFPAMDATYWCRISMAVSSCGSTCGPRKYAPYK